MCFEEKQPAFAFGEVDLDVAVGLLPVVDATSREHLTAAMRIPGR